MRQVDHMTLALVRVAVDNRTAAPFFRLGRQAVEVLPK
jgi:hypothetical protein